MTSQGSAGGACAERYAVEGLLLALGGSPGRHLSEAGSRCPWRLLASDERNYPAALKEVRS